MQDSAAGLGSIPCKKWRIQSDGAGSSDPFIIVYSIISLSYMGSNYISSDISTQVPVIGWEKLYFPSRPIAIAAMARRQLVTGMRQGE